MNFTLLCYYDNCKVPHDCSTKVMKYQFLVQVFQVACYIKPQPYELLASNKSFLHDEETIGMMTLS